MVFILLCVVNKLFFFTKFKFCIICIGIFYITRTRVLVLSPDDLRNNHRNTSDPVILVSYDLDAEMTTEMSQFKKRQYMRRNL
jgi:hypothetical protein